MFGRLLRLFRAGTPTSNVMSGTARDVVQAQHIDQVIFTGSDNRDDVRILQDITEANLRSLADHRGLTSSTGRSVVDRSEIQELAGLSGDFVITGEPGCGKSGLLAHLAEHLQGQGEDVVLLTVETLGETAGAIRGDVSLSRPLSSLLREWSNDHAGTLLIDGLDASRRESLAWLANLVIDLAGTRWRTIATMRRFDLRYSTIWRQAFAGPPVSTISERRDGELEHVRHFLLGDFSAAELEQLAADDPHVRKLVEAADDRLLRLMRNPFNLRIAHDLVKAGESALSLARTRDQLELLRRFWDRRVVDQPDGQARARVLTEITREMLARRALHAPTSAIPDTLLDARQAVLHDGVLKEVPGRLRATGSVVLVFAHHILFDFAVAALVLTEGDRSRLTEALDVDPNLVLVARPSIDLHLADVWHADPTRNDFTKVMIGLANSEHSLAGIAAASVVVSEAQSDDDLRRLVELTSSPDQTAAIATTVGWIAGVMGAADYQLTARVRSAMSLWTTFELRLTGRLTQDYDGQLASQAFRLLQQLQDVQPLSPGTTAAEGRADCVATMMSIGLASPDERGWLAQAAARVLPAAVEVRPSHAEVLRRTLGPDLMASWPSMYLLHYLENIATITKADTGLAEQVLLAVWQFEEDREEVTSLTQGVVSLTSTRKQDIEHLKWLIGEKFDEYLAEVGLRHAVPMLAAATTVEDPSLPPIGPSYPLVAGTTIGQVDLVIGSLKFSGAHESPLTILQSYVEALRTSEIAADEAEALVRHLVASIRHPEAWDRILLGAADNPAVVGRAFVPVLLAGGLFAHPGTRTSATALARSLAPYLSGTKLEELLRLAPDLDSFDAETAAPVSETMILRASPDDGDDGLTPAESEILDTLRQAVQAAENRQDLDTLETTLWQAVEGTKDLFERAPRHDTRVLVLRAAELLINERPPKPDTATGELIASLLLEAAASSTNDEADEQ